MRALAFLLAIAWACAPLRAAPPEIADYRVLFQPAMDHLQVTELIELAPGEGAPVVFVLPAGAHLDPSDRERLSREGLLRGDVVELSPGPEARRAQFSYILTTASGLLQFRRTLPLRAREVLGVAPEGRFQARAEGWALTRQATQRNGQDLGGSYALFLASEVSAGTALSVEFAFASRDPTTAIYWVCAVLLLGGFAALQLAVYLDGRAAHRVREASRGVLVELRAGVERAERGEHAAEELARLRSQIDRLLQP